MAVMKYHEEWLGNTFRLCLRGVHSALRVPELGAALLISIDQIGLANGIALGSAWISRYARTCIVCRKYRIGLK